MYNEMNMACVGCEALMCFELTDAYSFMISFLFDNTPDRPPDSVSYVSGDGFFSQEKLHELGFTHAHFIMDHWHLVSSGLPAMFGGRYPEIKDVGFSWFLFYCHL